MRPASLTLGASTLMFRAFREDPGLFWLVAGLDLNQRPSGYEPDELPGCSTPRHL